jgi:predicted PurR-regulated permease PerM
VGTVIVFLLVAVVLVLLPVFLVPVLIQQLRQLAAFDVGGTASSLFNWLLRTINELPEELVVFGVSIPTGNVVEQVETGFRQVTFVPTLAEVLGYIQQGLTAATGIVTSTAVLSVAVVARIFQSLITIILIFFLSLYMTKDMPAIRRYVEGLFPASLQGDLRVMIRRVGVVWSSFFRGQILLSLAVGTVTWIALTLVGMPGALVLAITAGVLEVVPQIGPIIATIPAVIVALIQGSSVLADYGVNNVGFALITIAIYFVIQQLEASLLVPRIIGESVNLHPVVIIIGVAVGFSAFGILGALLAAPTLASFRVVGGYVHARLLDYPPFEGKPTPGKPRTVYRVRVKNSPTARGAGEPLPTGGLPTGASALTTTRIDLRGDPAAYADAVAELPPLASDESSSRVANEPGGRVSSSTIQ